jgi:hypothetical protein
MTPVTTVYGTLTISIAGFAGSLVPPKARPIPREAPEPAIYSSGMVAQVVRAVLRRNEWQALEPRSNQILGLREFAETDATSTLSTEDVANTFNIRANTIRQIRHRADLKQENPPRRLTLDPEQEADVVRLIRERFGS